MLDSENKIVNRPIFPTLWSLQCNAAVPNLLGTRGWFRGRQFFHRLAWGSVSGGNASDGSGGNASDEERWGATDEASLTRPPLTSCCAARFLSGHGPVPGRWGPLV